jgi:hypothetical protein
VADTGAVGLLEHQAAQGGGRERGRGHQA